MGLSSVAAIAFSAMQAQSNNLSETADAIAGASVYQADEQPAREVPDLAAKMADLSEGELAYRANAAAFETGADLWDMLNIVPRD